MNTHSTPVKNTFPAPVQPNQERSESKEALLKSDPPTLFQASLSVGAPDDPFEHEAEKVSSQVMENYDQVTKLQRKLSDFACEASFSSLSHSSHFF